MDQHRIAFQDCRIGTATAPAIASVTWELKTGEVWLVTGPNGGGKSAFVAALAGALDVEPNDGGRFRNDFSGRAVLVSFEEAAALIERERANDDSDFVEGGVDEGTTSRAFIAQALPETWRGTMEEHPAVAACGVQRVLDRGLKRLSTGEIRRVLLARAMAGEYGLLVLDEPYEGLDAASRETLASLLEGLCARNAAGQGDGPTVVLVADRWERIPASVNRVLELAGRRIVFAGSRNAYECVVAERARVAAEKAAAEREALLAALSDAERDSEAFLSREAEPDEAPLVEFRGVTVAYGERTVLDRVDWKVESGEHWLIRGPNGSGKTTILELITGDNPQVFRNDVFLFGRKRGSGETIWELKERMGIVSYRLHVEYRSLNDSTLEDVLVSGLRDSIGLYGQAGDAELILARAWLALAGFAGRGGERFGRLSYGEQRALLVARAAIKGPRLLILDEPCHGLDEAQRTRVLSLLAAVADHGRSTLLYVTHDPAEFLPCIRRTLELRPGETPMWKVV